MANVLGLDLGTNSLGWALVALDKDKNPVRLVDGGVRIFPDGRNPKDKSSNARQRRDKRGPRRNRDRRVQRRRNLLRRLAELDLLPESVDERDQLLSQDPYRLRAEALDRPLTPWELGRALWHLSQGRGFQSNRKTDKVEDKGALKADISSLRRRIEQSGSRTLGEYLWRRQKQKKTVRARLGNGLYRDRAMVRAEFDAIRAKQQAHHALADKDWDELAELIFFQRKLKSPEVGPCTLIPSERRAMKASPLFQRYRILETLVNLEVAPPLETFRRLDKTEFDKLYLKLLDRKDLAFADIPPLLDLPEGARINLETTARRKILGDQTAAVLKSKKRFGRAWMNLELARQTEVVHRLLNDSDEAELTAWLQREFGLSDEQADAVANAPLPPGTGAFSETALARLIEPLKEQGLRLADAVQAAGFAHHSDLGPKQQQDRLPFYGEVLRRHVTGARDDPRNEVERYGRIGNPTAHIGLGQLRRLINEIIERYGKPDEVVIELARDLKNTADAKKRIQARQRDNLQRNERLKAEMEAAGFPFSPHTLRKLKLWDEQGKPGEQVCPFTGTPLTFQMVCSEETEIEHILPFSQTLDDRNLNKVVALRSANREKGNRTPFEAWGHDGERYQQILARAEAVPTKAWRFQPDAMQRFEEQTDFIGRQLNETRYLSRIAKEYLAHVVPANHIAVSPGELTALLRGKWGLNGILSDSNRKERTDHRHHMIDAIVVALTRRSMLQRIARAAGATGERLIDDMPEPWPGYYQDVRDRVLATIVAHKPDHGSPGLDGTTSGSLHNESAMGYVEGPDEGGISTLVIRKALADLKPADLAAVRDELLGRRLMALYEQASQSGGSDKDIWLRFCAEAERKLKVKRLRLLQREGNLVWVSDRQGQPYKAYKADGNAWMDIWRLPDGTVVGDTVTRFAANQKDYRSRIKDTYPTARKLMRLHNNDMVAVGEGKERRILRVQFLTGQNITMVDHNEGGNLRQRERSKDLEVHYVPLRKTAGAAIKAGLRKVMVTPTGQVLDAGPFGSDGRYSRV